MNLHDYEKKFFPTYEAFAETVRFILEKALRAAENLPRPQSIQCRAKGIESVRRCLAEVGKLDTQTPVKRGTCFIYSLSLITRSTPATAA